MGILIARDKVKRALYWDTAGERSLQGTPCAARWLPGVKPQGVRASGEGTVARECTSRRRRCAQEGWR